MGRGGQDKDRDDGPERKCLATGEVRPKSDLIRFVAGPDGTVVPDIAGKLPGRGFYVTADRKALETAVAKKLFSRGAKAPVNVPDGLVDEVERQLARRVVDLISLARKAGKAVAGYEKVKSWLDRDEARVLIQARKVEAEYAIHGRFHWLADRRRVGFGFRTSNCDTWGARLWRTRATCCRGSPSA